jgi:deoxyribodipyrimidine photolyase-related protein
VDPIKEEVIDLVESEYSDHPGSLDPEALTATRADAERVWTWAKEECLPHFGPFEDAMSERSDGLFHTRISFLLHVHRLLPARVVREVAELGIPLPGKEGFIRQVIGWREFMRHVHERTDGFRRVPTLSALGATNRLPEAYWGKSSGLRCLDAVVESVLRTGYSHHITRLMVLSNIAALLDVSPRELTDWFWVMYTDAFDWVVEPNVLGMGTFAAGDLMTTKPYVSGAAYIRRMSDYCDSCAFDPKRDCPLTALYWAFLERHEEQLRENPRMRLPLASLRKRDPERRARDREVFEDVREKLRRGEALGPDGSEKEG